MRVDTSENYLTNEEEKLLLHIARSALHTQLIDRRPPSMAVYTLTPTLQEKHGAFVTLRNQGELRGCIGYTANHMPLAQAVMENAINAGCNDYRFDSVTAEELPSITIEISALTPGDSPETPFKKISGPGDIVIGRDGLYIERPPGRGGILLPQVAVEQGWDVAQFLSGVCRKAGYPDGAWKETGVNLYRFSAQVFSESAAV